MLEEQPHVSSCAVLCVLPLYYSTSSHASFEPESRLFINCSITFCSAVSCVNADRPLAVLVAVSAVGQAIIKEEDPDDTCWMCVCLAVPVAKAHLGPWHLQVLEIAIKDSRITGRSSVGVVRVPLRSLPEGGRLNAWLPVVGNHARGGVSPRLPARPASRHVFSKTLLAA